MPRLQVLNGKRQGAVFDLAVGGELVIGHRATASIPIDDPWVSWDHARIYFQGATCQIEDLGSTNGTYVNCVRVKREELRHEDIVFLGKTHVLFLAPAEAHQAPFLAEDSSPEGLDLPFAPPSRAGGLSSEHGLFNSNSGMPPLVNAAPARDPFAAAARDPFAAAAREGFGPPAASDPFAAAARNPFAAPAPSDPFPAAARAPQAAAPGPVAVDPFASGPDYGDFGAPARGAAQDFAAPARGGTQRLGSGARGRADDLAISYSREEPEPSGIGPARVPSAITNPFSDDPISSGVLQANFGGGFHVNDLDELSSGARARQQPGELAPGARARAQPGELAPGARTRNDPFAETRGDDTLSPLREEASTSSKASRRSLSLSQIDDDHGEPELPAPSEREIADLIEASGRRRRTDVGSSLETSDELGALDSLPASEMRTREIDVRDVAQILAEHEARSSGTVPAPPPPPPPPPPAPAAGWGSGPPAAPLAPGPGTESTHADILAQAAREPQNPGQAAFERARLTAEVQRLRLALQAVQQRDPAAVQAAAQALRDAELGRLAQRVAELEREVAGLRHTLSERERELDEVTEDMIAKEDLIDRLQSSGGPLADDLSSLEF